MGGGITGEACVDAAGAPTSGPGIKVYYKVTAVRGGVESPFGNEYGWPDEVFPPEPPVNLGVEAGNNLVKVTWEASPSEIVGGYRGATHRVRDVPAAAVACDPCDYGRKISACRRSCNGQL